MVHWRWEDWQSGSTRWPRHSSLVSFRFWFSTGLSLSLFVIQFWPQFNIIVCLDGSACYNRAWVLSFDTYKFEGILMMFLEWCMIWLSIRLFCGLCINQCYCSFCGQLLMFVSLGIVLYWEFLCWWLLVVNVLSLLCNRCIMTVTIK